MKIFKILCITLCFIGLNSTIQAQEEKALMRILQDMSYEDKVKILEYAKQQEANIDEEIMRIMLKLPKVNKANVIDYAEALNGKSNKDGHEGHNHEEEPIIEGMVIPEPSDDVPRTSLKFEKTYINFGTVREGQVVEKKYTFENTGDVPLTIVNAQGSCGCTVPEWPRNPIPPGGIGTIRVRFNTINKPGKRSQNVVITANTDPGKTTLTLQGVVQKDR